MAQVLFRCAAEKCTIDLRFCRSLFRSSYSCIRGERYSLVKSERLFNAARPRLNSAVHKQWIFPRIVSLGLSTSSDGGSKEESLKWYDIDTPEFAKIVAGYQEGKTTAANLSLIDVREPEELTESGRVPGTINIPRKNS